MKPEDAWNAAYHQLELQLDRASFDTWLRPAVFLGVEDGIFVVGVHNSYAQDMLQYRLYRDVQRVLSDILGETVELRFEIHKKPVQDTTRGSFATDDSPLFRFLEQQERMPDLPEAVQDESSYGYRSRWNELPDYELNPRFRFNRFVVNQSNRVVYEAALAVSEHPGVGYNPFFIYGGVGLGKTHLLQSIAHIAQQRRMRAVYIPSEVFTNELVTAIRNRQTAMFRDKYRNADVLLVDDIQFIGGKETTQEEFFHTFNALVNFNKQIVLASDRHPRELLTLEDRLRSRFQGGLVADIQPPELETRIAILQMWSRERQVQLEPNVIEMIAQRAPKNVRELEGVFNQILAQVQLGSGSLSLPGAEDTLERYNKPRERVSLERIIDVTARKYGLLPPDLTGKRRTSRVNKARQVAMYLARQMTECSLPQIGEAFGGRSHSTVLHGANRIAEEIEEDRVLALRINKLQRDILSRPH